MNNELPQAVLKIVFDDALSPEMSTFFTAFTVLIIVLCVFMILHILERIFIHVLNYTQFSRYQYSSI